MTMAGHYDLHIHSALSPCGDNDMTPNNVINMALLNKLDILALTDHNSTFNIPAFSRVACDAGIIFVPGIELNTSEEVHLLGYFPDEDCACRFGDFIYNSLPDIKNNKDFFGDQLIMDESDNIVGEAEKLLISALPFSFEDCLEYVTSYGGVPVPAHINKGGNSLINNLGFVPDSSLFRTLEFRPEYPYKKDEKYNYIISSDAHYLQDIADPGCAFIESVSDASDVVKVLRR